MFDLGSKAMQSFNNSNARNPARGSHAAALWRADVITAWAEFSVHPPVAFALENAERRYRCLLPFGSGACDLAVDDGPLRRCRMRASAAIFVTPGVRLILRSVEPVEFLLVAIDPDQMDRLASATAMGRDWHARTLLDHHDPALRTLGTEIRRALLSDALPLPPYLQSLADAIALRFLCHFLGEVKTLDPGEKLSAALFARIVRHIDSHLSEHLAVADLAAMVGLTRSHFSRAFQRMTGDPPQRFITKRRISRARDLLSSEKVSLAEIAAQVGFSSQAHFSTVFRKDIGTTPARYRAAFGSGGI